MKLGQGLILGFAILMMGSATTISLKAQIRQGEISQSHLDRAFETVFMTRTSRAYNEVIPNLAHRARLQLLEKRPDLKREIEAAINDVALALVDQQGELDLLIARSWAERFTEEELREITTFFATPTGTKLAKRNTELIAIGLDIARQWGAQKGTELIRRVQQRLKEQGHDLGAGNTAPTGPKKGNE